MGMSRKQVCNSRDDPGQRQKFGNQQITTGRMRFLRESVSENYRGTKIALRDINI